VEVHLDQLSTCGCSYQLQFFDASSDIGVSDATNGTFQLFGSAEMPELAFIKTKNTNSHTVKRA
jgi:hypothetical protein